MKSNEMYLPLCDICKHQNDTTFAINTKTGESTLFVCSKRKKGCPGFEPMKVGE